MLFQAGTGKIRSDKIRGRSGFDAAAAGRLRLRFARSSSFAVTTANTAARRGFSGATRLRPLLRLRTTAGPQAGIQRMNRNRQHHPRRNKRSKFHGVPIVCCTCQDDKRGSWVDTNGSWITMGATTAKKKGSVGRFSTGLIRPEPDFANRGGAM